MVLNKMKITGKWLNAKDAHFPIDKTFPANLLKIL